MWQAFNIPLTQGLEAFLVVAVALAWLRRARRLTLIRAARGGIAVSVVSIPAAAQLFSSADHQALWQGVLGVAAAVSVALLIVWVARDLRSSHGYGTGRADGHAAAASGTASIVAIFLFVALMISRQGMETALLLSILLFQMYSDAAVIACAAGGVVLAVVVAWLWGKLFDRLDHPRWRLATFTFLGLLLVQLFMGGVYRLTEAGALPYTEVVHLVTEPFGPDGAFGPALRYALVVVPGGCLLLRPRARVSRVQN